MFRLSFFCFLFLCLVGDVSAIEVLSSRNNLSSNMFLDGCCFFSYQGNNYVVVSCDSSSDSFVYSNSSLMIFEFFTKKEFSFFTSEDFLSKCKFSYVASISVGFSFAPSFSSFSLSDRGEIVHFSATFGGIVGIRVFNLYRVFFFA